MHHRLGDGPQRGEDARDVDNEGTMHGFRIVVRGHIGHFLEVRDQLATGESLGRELRGDHVHAYTFQVLDAAQTLQLACLLTVLVQRVDAPFLNITS
jgi:hypothetical protein